MWYYNAKIIKTPKPLEVDGVTYPASIFKNPDLLAELGVVNYREDRVDSRYYWTGSLTIENGVGTYESIPRDVETLKENMLSKVSQQLSSRQEKIDWYWQREDKGGKVVPQEIKDYAVSLYADQESKETAIEALVTLEDVIAYENVPHVEVRLMKHTSEDGTETYGPETESFNRDVNMVTGGWTVNPTDKVDPSFVSLTAV